MTFRIVLFASLGVVAVGVIYFLSRRSGKFVDLGTVSESWLAEHRAGPSE